MLADLHVHSIYSDGRYTPDFLCQRAKERGISLLSVTDHDTMLGEEDKRQAAQRYGISYLSGWEISAYADGQKLHILGYGCRLGEAYHAFKAERERAAFLRAEDSVQKLQKIGVPVTMDEVLLQRSAPNLPVHTMHLSRAIAKKLSVHEGEAYLRFLNVGCPAYSDIGRPTPEQAIDCIHACGGVASVAHPGRITLNPLEKEKMLRALAKYGADGIEAVYQTHTEEETDYFLRLAKELGLFVTGGSDTHYESETHYVGSTAFTPAKEFLERVRVL